MDHFHEQVITRKNKTGASILAFFLTVAACVLAVLAVFELGSVPNAIGEGWAAVLLTLLDVAIYGGLAFVCFGLRNRFRVEYEYSFTNGLMEFAQVINNSRRKELASVGYKDVECIGLLTGAAYAKYAGEKDVKKINCCLTRDRERYFVYAVRGEKKQLIVLEPDEEMVALMHEYFGKLFEENAEA